MNGRPRRSSIQNQVKNSTIRGPVGDTGRRHKPDYWILVLTAFLLTIGLVVVYSISPGLAASQDISQNYFITKQLIDVGLGLAAFAAAAYLPIKLWYKLAMPLVVAAAIACVAVLLVPVDEIYRAHRWIIFGGVSFQVAELVKLAVLVWAAVFLARQWRRGLLDNFNSSLKPLLIALVVISFVVAKLQSDLGSAAVIIAMLGIMAYSAGLPLRRIMIIAGVIAAALILAISTSSYRRERLTTFLNPEANCLDTGYQACQALISVGSGGLFGLGLGYSVQAYGYLPEASDDSIFAIMAEKFGFIGTAFMVIVYGVFISRLKRVIERTGDQFNRLLAVGVLAWLSTQMIINIGAMLGLLPLKGITLPLISQGGTSLVFLTAALGIVFNISRYTNYNATEPLTSSAEPASSRNSFDGRRVRRAYNTATVTRPRA